MAKVVDLKPETPSRTNLAAEVAPKLEAARARLAELESHVNAAALAATLEEPGAADRLANLNDRLDVARRDVTQLEGAYRLAGQRDAQAQAAIEAKARQTELAALQKIADLRQAAMVEMCRAIEIAAKAHAKFVDLTGKFALALPTGQIPHAINWNHVGILIDGVEFPAAPPWWLAAKCSDTRSDRRTPCPAVAHRRKDCACGLPRSSPLPMRSSGSTTIWSEQSGKSTRRLSVPMRCDSRKARERKDHG